MTRFKGLPAILAIAAVVAIPTCLDAQGDQRGGDRTTGSTGAGVRTEGAGAVGRDMGGGGVASSSGWSGGGSSSGGSAGGGSSPMGSSFSNDAFSRRPFPGNAGTAGRRMMGSDSGGARDVPWYSRSRGDRPAVGTAAGRSDGGMQPGPGGTRYWDWYLYGYNYYYGGYAGSHFYDCLPVFGYGGFGLGYFYYDPAWWTYPIGGCGPWYGHGYPYGRMGYGYGYGGGFAGGYSRGSSGESGLKLKIKPANARVFVDGYFAGEVDEFDGAFQKLALNAGRHRIEIRADGYEPITFDVDVEPFQTITHKAELRRIQ